MKKKNGFVFIETMITIVILAAALLTMYTLFTNMLVTENRRVYYDDPIYIYKGYYLMEFLHDRFDYANQKLIDLDPDREMIGIEAMLTTLADDDATPISLYMKSLTCDNDIFNDEVYSATSDCKKFFSEQKLYRIYISRSDLSYLDTCEGNSSIECFEFRTLNDQAKRYMKTLSYVPGSQGYYIVFEFNDDGNGNVCSSEGCMHAFSTVKYGGTNQIVNLNE